MEDGNNGHYNGNGSGNGSGNGHNSGPDPLGEDDPGNRKIIRFPDSTERDRLKKREESRNNKNKNRSNAAREPLLNLPPATKILMMAFFAVFVPMQLFLDPEKQYWVYMYFGIVPARYTGYAPFDVGALFGLFAYMFLHGSWMHLIVNAVMTMAFGAVVERWMGVRRFLVYFFVCGIAAGLIQVAVSYDSGNPIIGASGALNGFFAGVLLVMQSMGMGGRGRYGIWPIAFVWIGLTALFGMTGIGFSGAPSVAWVAHIGGFLAGFVLYKPVMKYVR